MFFFVINCNYKKKNIFYVSVLIQSVQAYTLKYRDTFTTFLLWLDSSSVLALLKACSYKIIVDENSYAKRCTAGFFDSFRLKFPVTLRLLRAEERGKLPL